MWIAAISNTTDGLHSSVERFLGSMEIDWIFHCGNIGSNDVLVALSEHAPTTGVLGPNDDVGELPFGDNLVKTLEGCSIYMASHIGSPIRPNEATAQAIDKHSPKVVFFAGEGPPSVDIINGVVWVSPGNPTTDDQSCSVAVIELRGGHAYPEIIKLDAVVE